MSKRSFCTRNIRRALIPAAAFMPCAGALGQGAIVGIGDLPGGYYQSIAYDLSGDGSTVVGTSATPPGVARGFRWTAASGITPMGPDGGLTEVEPKGVSRDGFVVVGISGNQGVPQTGWRWTPTLGYVPLPRFWADPNRVPNPTGVSGDGFVVVGNTYLNDQRNACYWAHPAYTLVYLPMIDAHIFPRARACSRDGGVICGQGISAGGTPVAGRWTAAGGVLAPNWTDTNSTAYAVSADSSTIVGSMVPRNGPQNSVAFAWSGSSIISLGTLPGDISSVAHDVSADGSVIVGYSTASNGSVRVFIRDAAGMRPLADHLAANGISVAGWTLHVPFSTVGTLVSDDATVFAGTGLNPRGQLEAWIANVDADGDGLLNHWETHGIDADNDGGIDLILPGADPNHKNIYIEVDSMAGYAMLRGAADDVVSAFAAVPNALVNNPDGATGIRLEILLDDANLPAAPWDADPWPEFNGLKSTWFGSDDPPRRAAQRMAYRYCIFADNFDGMISGNSELGGNDFMVTLGNWIYTPTLTERTAQAGAFMHELGHTLGLRHGGGDGINFKPNYFSVMNYMWQMPVTPYHRFWTLDYSRSTLPTLDEMRLNEMTGISQVPVRVLPHGPPPVRYAFSVGPVDFNRNGYPSDAAVAADLNYLGDNIRGGEQSPAQLLIGFTDWSRLDYNFRDSADYADGVNSNTTGQDELDYPTLLALNALPPYCPADFDGDGFITGLDFDTFVTAFESGDPSADFDRDGFLTGLDFDAYVAAFEAGC